MSMYYNPRIVRLLAEERLREAREARLAHERRSGSRQGAQLVEPLRRLFVRQPAATRCTC